MKTESKHTPGPWVVGQERDSIPRIYRQDNKSHSGVICQFGEGMDEDRQLAKNYAANAAFIARACNCHKELLKACKAADRLLLQVATLANNPDTIRYWPGGLREQVLDWVRDNPADKAIAKAEGSL